MSVRKFTRFIISILFFFFTVETGFSQEIKQDSVVSDSVKTGFFHRLFAKRKGRQTVPAPKGSLSTDGKNLNSDFDAGTDRAKIKATSGKYEEEIRDSIRQNLTIPDSIGAPDPVDLNTLPDSLQPDLNHSREFRQLQSVQNRLAQSETKARKTGERISSLQKQAEKEELARMVRDYTKIPSENKLPDKYQSSYLKQFKAQYDSVQQQMDSLRTIDFPADDLQDSWDTESLSAEKLQLLDSLKPKNPFKEKLTEVSDSVSRLDYKKKNLIPFGNYKEIVVGARENFEEGITLSPALGFDLTKSISFGLGGLIDLNFKRKYVNIGYRTFLRYAPLRHLYCQVEGTHYFKDLSNPTEAPSDKEVEKYQYNLSAGIGGRYPLIKKINLNVQLLYQIITTDYYPNVSPVVFRAGVNF